MMRNSVLGGERARPQSSSGDDTHSGSAPAGLWPSIVKRAAMPGLLLLALSGIAVADELPARYFRLPEAGVGQVEKRLNDNPGGSMSNNQRKDVWAL